MSIRRITGRDFPWCHEICGRAYSGEWDMVDGETWFTELLRRSDYYLARGIHCLIVGAVGALPFNRKKIAANMKILVSDGKAGFEVIALVKSFMAWARNLGATRFTFDTRDNIDFGPIASRLGAKPYGPAYVVEM